MIVISFSPHVHLISQPLSGFSETFPGLELFTCEYFYGDTSTKEEGEVQATNNSNKLNKLGRNHFLKFRDKRQEPVVVCCSSSLLPAIR